MRNKFVSRHWAQYQPLLFASPDPELVFTESLQKLIIVMDTIAPDKFDFLRAKASTGRPPINRVAMFSVFIAKSVLNIPDNKFMRERLLVDYTLRRICGFHRSSEVPCEATFSNVFNEFAKLDLTALAHEDLIRGYLGDLLLEHVSRDATAIPAREKAKAKELPKEPNPPKKRGRRKKGESPEKVPKR